jgi:hypothetical protein
MIFGNIAFLVAFIPSINIISCRNKCELHSLNGDAPPKTTKPLFQSRFSNPRYFIKKPKDSQQQFEIGDPVPELSFDEVDPENEEYGVKNHTQLHSYFYKIT